MKKEDQEEITEISKEFALGFKDTIGEIAGSGMLIVDPLGGYLDFVGYKNKLYRLPARTEGLEVLVIRFEDGSQFIPAGSDLPLEGAHDWLWPEPTKKYNVNL